MDSFLSAAEAAKTSASNSISSSRLLKGTDNIAASPSQKTAIKSVSSSSSSKTPFNEDADRLPPNEEEGPNQTAMEAIAVS
jgi:hypothetical protein